jgi:hypothetical protein
MNMNELAGVITLCEELLKLIASNGDYDDRVVAMLAVELRAKAYKLMNEE